MVTSAWVWLAACAGGSFPGAGDEPLPGLVDPMHPESTDRADEPAATDPADPADPATGLPLLLGAYSPEYVGSSDSLEAWLLDWDAAVPERLSLAGFFYGLDDSNPGYNIPNLFGTLTDAGYTPMMNLGSNESLASLAAGDMDSYLEDIAAATADWADDYPDTFAYVSILHEMNGEWEPYFGDPETFKAFYRHVQDLFAEAGVPDHSVKWVFAPNGFSEEGNEFELYYPGDDAIDAVGVSAYMWGGCKNHDWGSADEVYTEYLDRLAAMAPGKPLFLTQTGASSYTSDGGSDPARKDAFLQEAYTLLADRGDVLGVMYFNIDKECDWQVWRDGDVLDGYEAAVAHPGVGYISPLDLAAAL